MCWSSAWRATGAHIATKITAGMVNPFLTGGITYVDGGGALV
jgi:hypothetical protein